MFQKIIIVIWFVLAITRERSLRAYVSAVPVSIVCAKELDRGRFAKEDNYLFPLVFVLKIFEHWIFLVSSHNIVVPNRDLFQIDTRQARKGWRRLSGNIGSCTSPFCGIRECGSRREIEKPTAD